MENVLNRRFSHENDPIDSMSIDVCLEIDNFRNENKERIRFIHWAISSRDFTDRKNKQKESKRIIKF